MKYVIANFKSNKNLSEIRNWRQSFEVQEYSNVTTIVAPPLPYLSLFKDESRRFLLAAQDVSPFPMGSYTGAVNAAQLKDFGVTHALVGHSERRRYFHESHQEIANKIQQLLDNEIIPILCIDEEYIAAQSKLLSDTQKNSMLVAYEPLSAIGTGVRPDLGTVQRIIAQIKKHFGEDTITLYGGSVTEQDCREFLIVADGLLVGGASLDAAHFSRIVAAAANS